MPRSQAVGWRGRISSMDSGNLVLFLNQYSTARGGVLRIEPNVWEICAGVGKKAGEDKGREDGLGGGQLRKSSRPWAWLLTDRERSGVPFSSRRRRRSTTSVCVNSKGRSTCGEATPRDRKPRAGVAHRPRPVGTPTSASFRAPLSWMRLCARDSQSRERFSRRPCRKGCVSRRRPAARPWASAPRTHVRDVAGALVPDVVEAQVERDQGAVAAVQCGQSLAQELRPAVVNVVVTQRQVRDPGQREGEGRSTENTGSGRWAEPWRAEHGGGRRAIRSEPGRAGVEGPWGKCWRDKKVGTRNGGQAQGRGPR